MLPGWVKILREPTGISWFDSPGYLCREKPMERIVGIRNYNGTKEGRAITRC